MSDKILPKIICMVKKILNKILKKKNFIILKENFNENPTIANFKTLIIYWNYKIKKRMCCFKYCIFYNLNLSLTNTLGNPLFINKIIFSQNNIFTNSMENLTDSNILSLFNAYINNKNILSQNQKQMIVDVIQNKNKKWINNNNNYVRFTPGAASIDITTPVRIAAVKVYDFTLGDTLSGGKAYPAIPKYNTPISIDYYYNFYLSNKTNVTILSNKNNKYLWGYVASDNNNTPIYGCTGVHAFDGDNTSTNYYGDFSMGQNTGQLYKEELYTCFANVGITSSGSTLSNVENISKRFKKSILSHLFSKTKMKKMIISRRKRIHRKIHQTKNNKKERERK